MHENGTILITTKEQALASQTSTTSHPTSTYHIPRHTLPYTPPDKQIMLLKPVFELVIRLIVGDSDKAVKALNDQMKTNPVRFLTPLDSWV